MSRGDRCADRASSASAVRRPARRARAMRSASRVDRPHGLVAEADAAASRAARRRATTAGGRPWQRARSLLGSLQGDLAAEPLAGLLLAARRARPARPLASASSTAASPSSRRIAIQRAFGTPGAACFDQRHQFRDRALELRRARCSAAAASRPRPTRHHRPSRAAHACLRRCAPRCATAGTPRSRDRLRSVHLDALAPRLRPSGSRPRRRGR